MGQWHQCKRLALNVIDRGLQGTLDPINYERQLAAASRILGLQRRAKSAPDSPPTALLPRITRIRWVHGRFTVEEEW